MTSAACVYVDCAEVETGRSNLTEGVLCLTTEAYSYYTQVRQ